MTECAYKDHMTIPCEGPVRVTIHDQRGCVDVCAEHAIWRLTQTSMAVGHSMGCKHVSTVHLPR